MATEQRCELSVIGRRGDLRRIFGLNTTAGTNDNDDQIRVASLTCVTEAAPESSTLAVLGISGLKDCPPGLLAGNQMENPD